MCFAIPYKVEKIINGKVLIEGGKEVTLGKELTVQIGGYVRVVGNIAVDTLTKKEGLKIRQLIKSLNTYEQ
ncbi:hypothetical protein ACFL1P_01365 [Patescibacteria group bacterium]